jgi:hypothetical protein
MNKILDKWLHKKNIYVNIDRPATNPVPPAPPIQGPKMVFGDLSFNNVELVRLYRGKFLHKLGTINMHIPVAQRQTKVMVFDLDETIGSFGEFVLLLYSLERILGQPYENNETEQQVLFNALLDLYPSFLRYGILNVFQFLNKKKRSNECYKIYIYTNNKYSPEFPNKIQKYVDYKLDTNGFIDKIISAFKIGDRIIEPSRTTNEKTHSDFIRCTMLPKHTEICFVDNMPYEDMKHNKIFYLQPKNYYHKMEWKNIVNTFIQSPVYSTYFDVSKKGEMREYLYGLKTTPTYIGGTPSNDIPVYQKLLCYVKEFFLLTTRREKTKKVKYGLGRFTRKKKKK